MGLDKGKLSEFLRQHADGRRSDDATQLAIGSVYRGLYDRVQRGDFDEERG